MDFSYFYNVSLPYLAQLANVTVDQYEQRYNESYRQGGDVFQSYEEPEEATPENDEDTTDAIITETTPVDLNELDELASELFAPFVTENSSITKEEIWDILSTSLPIRDDKDDLEFV